MAQTKILVAIASFGVNNDSYLACLIKEYQSMSFHVAIVVISNLQKEVGPGVELSIVDLRGKNPWSLPFAHKKLLASGVDHYDLFVYSEDDTLITEANLRAFQRVSRVVPQKKKRGVFFFSVNISPRTYISSP